MGCERENLPKFFAAAKTLRFEKCYSHPLGYFGFPFGQELIHLHEDEMTSTIKNTERTKNILPLFSQQPHPIHSHPTNKNIKWEVVVNSNIQSPYGVHLVVGGPTLQTGKEIPLSTAW